MHFWENKKCIYIYIYIYRIFSYNDELLYVLPDLCHMLKLARNALKDLDIFIDGDVKLVKWCYIRDLFEL